MIYSSKESPLQQIDWLLYRKLSVPYSLFFVALDLVPPLLCRSVYPVTNSVTLGGKWRQIIHFNVQEMPETKTNNTSDQQGVKFTQKSNLTTFLNWARWVLELVSFWPTFSFVSLLVGCNTFIDRSFRASFFLACWTKKYNQTSSGTRSSQLTLHSQKE